MKESKGEITAFLSMIFVLLVSFILAMAQSARIQTTKNLQRLYVDRAMFSVFGEYQQELLEAYEIFGLDASYGTGMYEEQQILNRMSYYGSMGIIQEITEIQLLTDNDGQAFREQVLEYIETGTGIGVLRDVTGMSADWEEKELRGEAVAERLDDALGQGEELLPEENAEVLEVSRSGILSLVLPPSFELSGKFVGKENLVSFRERRTGRGSFPARSGAGNLAEKLLFERYVLEKFNSAVEKKSDARNLDYEIEYLIAGKEQDEENLKAVVNRLLLVRLALNYAFLMTDTRRQGEAETMAAVMATMLLHPEVKDALKQLLLLLWCFGESVVDLRTLLAGRKAAPVKQDSNWQLPLTGIFTVWYSDLGYEGTDTEQGLSYQHYLQVLLHLKEAKELNLRTLDRIEQNLRFEKGIDGFCADACVTKIKIQNRAEMWSGYTYSFPSYFGYQSR